MFNPTTPVNGTAISGFTSPTYSLVVDVPQTPYERQWYIQTAGGTQANVVAHSADRPFTLRTKRPSKILGLINKLYGANGLLVGTVPVNTYDILVNTRGVIDAAGNTGPIRARLQLDVAAGAPSTANGAAQIKAALSLLLGACVQDINGLKDNPVNGTN